MSWLMKYLINVFRTTCKRNVNINIFPIICTWDWSFASSLFLTACLYNLCNLMWSNSVKRATNIHKKLKLIKLTVKTQTKPHSEHVTNLLVCSLKPKFSFCYTFNEWMDVYRHPSSTINWILGVRSFNEGTNKHHEGTNKHHDKQVSLRRTAILSIL